MAVVHFRNKTNACHATVKTEPDKTQSRAY